VAEHRVLAGRAEQGGDLGGVALDDGDRGATLLERALGAGGQHGR
jgi:hypothetical protein